MTELNDFVKVLDKRADEQKENCKHHAAERKPRLEGADATSEPPANPPKWAINRLWRKGIYTTRLQDGYYLVIICYYL